MGLKGQNLLQLLEVIKNDKKKKKKKNKCRNDLSQSSLILKGHRDERGNTLYLIRNLYIIHHILFITLKIVDLQSKNHVSV